MPLPINRTAKSVIDANLVNGILSDGPKLKANDDVIYDTIDELYNYVLGLVTSGTLSPLPPNFVQYQSLFNGGFSINQRVMSGTVILAAGAYGHDRWKAGSAGCTYTFATSTNITTITITAGSLVQVIEGTNLYDGTYTLSWTGTAQGKIGAGSYAASGITGTVVGGTNLSIEFNVGTLSKAQFNKGSTALPYQPRSFADELFLCMRYFEPLDFNALTSLIRSGVNKIYTKYPFKVQKRVAPILSSASDLSTTLGNGSKQVSLFKVADDTAITATGSVTISGDSSTFMTKNIGSVIFSAATSFTGTAGDMLYIAQTTKDTITGFDAEL